MARIIESVPNFSEGRNRDVIGAIVDSLRADRMARILDLSSDPDHNRTVLTLAGDERQIRTTLLKLFEMCLERIDLRAHQGEHPRMGAVDVVPFIPIRDVSMEECAELSRQIAKEVAERFELPVFLYEEAASAPHRQNLAEIRRGEFEGLAKKMKDARWKPDFGPQQPHPSAGAVAMGAREFLIAFNVNLSTSDLSIAKTIAKAVRHSGGGLRYCKAMGVALSDRGLVQVSMNMVNFKKTPLYRAVELIRREAARFGVNVVGSEIVGLAPQAALLDAADYYLQLESFESSQILEHRLEDSE